MKKDEKILKWRLSEKPTANTLMGLAESKIITIEEARQIILDETEYNSKDFSDVMDEIKLLRKIVMKLSDKQPQTIIKIIESNPIYIRDYPRYPWIQPWVTWSVNTAQSLGQQVSSNMMNCAQTIGHSQNLLS